jgi:RimJ/RimL family protein N-acetyltransferase
LRADAAEVPWRIRVMVELDSGVVIGSINAKGPPDPRGDVEIGWGVSTTHRRRGFAFEAAAAVIQWAIAQPRVRSVSARVPEDNEASGALAAKLGMVRTALLRDGLPVWQLQLGARVSPSGE